MTLLQAFCPRAISATLYVCTPTGPVNLLSRVNALQELLLNASTAHDNWIDELVRCESTKPVASVPIHELPICVKQTIITADFSFFLTDS